MRRSTFAALLVPLMAASSSCYHSTQIAASWKDPSAQPLHFQKTVTVFVTKDETMRRTVEDKLAAKFPNGVPSYRILPNVDASDKAQVLSQLRDAGFDGAVVMRVVDVTTQAAYVPGTYWYGAPYGFSTYWNSAWAYPYDPGYVVADRIVSIETQVYALANDRLLFAARSETTNPASAGKLTDSVIRHVTERMRKDGLLALLAFTARVLAV